MTESEADEAGWTAPLGDPGVSATWLFSAVGWATLAVLGIRAWWNALPLESVTCSAAGCVPTGWTAAAMGGVVAVAALGTALLAMRAWAWRPRTSSVKVTRVALAVGRYRLPLSRVRGVGSRGRELLVMTADGDIEAYDLGDGALAREVAATVNRRARLIERAPDDAALAWMASLERLRDEVAVAGSASRS